MSRFPPKVLDALRATKYLRVRAGDTDHRFTGIWVVVVGDRVFVRSWYRRPGGWYRTLQDDPRGAILVGEREVQVRAKPVRGERLLAAVDRAYREKYPTPANRRYVQGFARGARRATTTELVRP